MVETECFGLESAAVVSARYIMDGEQPVIIDGVPINYALEPANLPNFDGRLPMFREHVLVRVDSFSCNYRDKAIILSFAEKIAKNPTSSRSSGFGSEFAGEIVAVGVDVNGLSPGDRVMTDATYPNDANPEFQAGLATNYASNRWAVFHQDKVRKIPDWLTTQQAAAYTLAAQTAYSMIRKSGIREGKSVIVGSSRSNTSLVIIKMLSTMGVNIVAVSSSDWSERQVETLQVPNIEFVTLSDGRFSRAIDKVDVVLDPFADINFTALSAKLKMGGSYVTCGFKNQHPANVNDSDRIPNMYITLYQLIANNQSLIGNCIGLDEDLNAALSLGECSLVPIDSVYGTKQIGEFLNRTFNEQKFGKVVFDYTL